VLIIYLRVGLALTARVQFSLPPCLAFSRVIDCLVGNADGTVHYYHNDGNASAPAYTLNSTDFFG